MRRGEFEQVFPVAKEEHSWEKMRKGLQLGCSGTGGQNHADVCNPI